MRRTSVPISLLLVEMIDRKWIAEVTIKGGLIAKVK